MVTEALERGREMLAEIEASLVDPQTSPGTWAVEHINRCDPDNMRDVIAFVRALEADHARSKLWCVHIAGPDDVVAVDSYHHAVETCRVLNASWGAVYKNMGWGSNFDPSDEFAPRCFAVPMIWPHDAPGHADGLQSPSDDYADAVSQARAASGDTDG